MSCIFTTTFGEQVKVAVIEGMDELVGIHERTEREGIDAVTILIRRADTRCLVFFPISLPYTHTYIHERLLRRLLASRSRKTRLSGTRPFSRPALIRFTKYVEKCHIYVIVGRYG